MWYDVWHMAENQTGEVKSSISPEINNEENREWLIDKFKKLGIWEEVDGVPVVDTAAFLDLPLSSNRTEHVVNGKKQGVILVREIEGERHRFGASEIFELLRDVAVVDTNELSEKGVEIPPAPLFIVPESVDDAYQLKWTIESNGYRYPWEIGKNVSNWSREITLKNGETMRLDELFLIQKVFGDFSAERTVDDFLAVRYPDSKNYKVFSAFEFCKKAKFVGGRLSGGTQSGFQNSPLSYILENCPRLLERGLFRASDFRRTYTGAGEYFRNDYLVRENGTVNLNGVSHTLGRAYDNMRVIVIDSATAAVIGEDNSSIVATFPVVTNEEKTQLISEEKRKMAEQGREWSLSGRLAISRVKEVERFNPESVSACREGESDEACQGRQEKLRNIESLIKIGHKLTMEAHIGVHKILNFDEQIWLGQAANQKGFDQDRIIGGAKKYGTTFLKSFLSVEADPEMSEKICDLSEKLPGTLGWRVFGKYKELVDSSENIGIVLEELFQDEEGVKNNPELSKQIKRHLLERGRQVLLGAHGRIKELKEDPEEAGRLLDDLENTKSELLLFATACRDAKKIGGLNLAEALRNKIEIIMAPEINEEDREVMRDIFRRNRTQYDETTLKVSLEDFEEALYDPKSKFQLLRREKQIIAFIRVRHDVGGESYIGSYNVEPTLKGYALGGAIFDRTFDQEAATRIVTGMVTFDNPQLPNYVNKHNWFINGIKEINGARYYSLRHEVGASEPASVNINEEEIRKTAGRIGPGEDSTMQYTEASPDEVERLCRNGYQVTRIVAGKDGGLPYFVFERVLGQNSRPLPVEHKKLAA